MVQEEFINNQIIDCKISLLEQVDQYILVLPTELGCLPCQYFHAFCQSSKYNHVEQRKEQLLTFRKRLQNNNYFCAIDLLKYINLEIGEFNGEYGKKFFQSCTRKLSNLISLLKKSLIAYIDEEESTNILCMLCHNNPANMRFSCGHQLSCESCEESRFYHLCLYCDQEDSLEEIYLSSLLKLIREQDCAVCSKSNQPLCYLEPCGHTETCKNCVARINKCPICCTPIIKKSHINFLDYNKICLLCDMEKSNIIYKDCNHISSCWNCESKLSAHICPMCKLNARNSEQTVIYF